MFANAKLTIVSINLKCVALKNFTLTLMLNYYLFL